MEDGRGVPDSKIPRSTLKNESKRQTLTSHNMSGSYNSTRANPSSNTIYEYDDNQASEGKRITLTPQDFITGWLQCQTIFLMMGVKMT